MDLEEIRQKIDEIDSTIIENIAKRLDISKEVGQYKKRNNLDIENKEREEDLIQKNATLLKKEGFNDEKLIRQIYSILISKSKDIQEIIINEA